MKTWLVRQGRDCLLDFGLLGLRVDIANVCSSRPNYSFISIEIFMDESQDPKEAAQVCRDGLLSEFQEMWSEADQIWEQHHKDAGFFRYVSADYQAVFEALSRVQGRATFLEWGSGLGVATIMASRMGFEAYGIEAESELVDYSETFAKKYGPSASFAHGSFIPEEFQWDPAEGEEVFRTIIDLPSAYDVFDLELRDFDLVYAYPWPDEYMLYCSILRQYGRSGSMLLSYDAREGMLEKVFGE